MAKPTAVRYVRRGNEYDVSFLRQTKGGKAVVKRLTVPGRPGEQAFDDAVKKAYESLVTPPPVSTP